MIYTRSKILKRTRSLRHHSNEAEKRLWAYLRNRRLHGHKFNRQVPLGGYILDFLCAQSRLIVEVDGATHSEAHEIAYDEKRARLLNAQGFRVLRFNSVDVSENLDSVLDSILRALTEV